MGGLWLGESNGCWIDLWDGPAFNGQKVRLWGPNDFVLLRVGEPDMLSTVQSIRVGPGAYVQCYEDLNFPATVVWLLPNQTVKSVADMQGSDDLDSIRIFDRPPFGREPGYSAYMLWAAHHLKVASEKQITRSNKTPDGLH